MDGTFLVHLILEKFFLNSRNVNLLFKDCGSVILLRTLLLFGFCRQLTWLDSSCLACGEQHLQSQLFHFLCWAGWSLPYTWVGHRSAKDVGRDDTQMGRLPWISPSWVPLSFPHGLGWAEIRPLGPHSSKTAVSLFLLVFQLPWAILKLWPTLRTKLGTWETHPMLPIFSKFQLLSKTYLRLFTFQSPQVLFIMSRMYCCYL